MNLATGSTLCALRAGLPDDDGECGRQPVFVLTDRNGNSWGACFEHLARTMEVMAPNAPITAEPVSSNLGPERPEYMTPAQYDAIRHKSWEYKVPFRPHLFSTQFDLPTGWVTGTIGPITVGVSPEGEIHS